MSLQKRIKSFLILLIIVGWSIVLGIQSCKNDSGKFDFRSDTSTESLLHKNFIGSESCRSCHENEYEDWSVSHHAKSMMVANDSTVLGDFNNVKFRSKGVTSTFFKKGDKYFVNTIGRDGKMEDFEIVYTFGITPLQQYLVKFPAGRFQALHLSWDSENNEWFEQYPRDTFPTWDWLHWTNGAMTWNSMCADCHSTNLRKNYIAEEDRYETTWSIINVSCEACHGPGKRHVEYINSNAYDPANINKGSFLKLTPNISSIEQVEQCAPCHSRRSMITKNYDQSGRFLDHFVPEILREEFYYGDGQIKEEDYVYGSFVQSKMFMNGVKCSNCHNVHSGQLLFSGNALCTQCHQKTKYDTPDHHFHPLNTESANCINCHMPGEYYMVNDFRRDHSFRIPRPDQSILFDVPNACNQCHTDQSAEWASEAVNKWYGPDRKKNYTDMLLSGNSNVEDLIRLVNDFTQPSIARATALNKMRLFAPEDTYQTIAERLSDRNARVRIEAINSLSNFPQEERIRLLSPLLQDPIRSVRITAAGILADTENASIPLDYQEAFESTTQEYEESLEQNEDFSYGQFQIGQYQEMKGNDTLAINAYRRSIKTDSLNGIARINLSRVYNRIGRNDLAIRSLKDQIIVDPRSVDGYYYLGLVQAEVNDVDEAIKAFRKSIELQPFNPRFYYNLGLLLQKNGQPDAAEKVFTEALSIIPDADDVRYALATSYFENGKMELALQQAQILAEKYPQNPNIIQLMSVIRESLEAN